MSLFGPLVDRITTFAGTHVPAATPITEIPGTPGIADIRALAMADPALRVILGSRGKATVEPVEAGDGALAITFSACFVARGGASLSFPTLAAAGRATADAAVGLAAQLVSWLPGIDRVTETRALAVDFDTPIELQPDGIVCHTVSWVHQLIIGTPQADSFDAEIGAALVSAEWERGETVVAVMPAEVIAELGAPS
ncbi:hypothetical protein [Phreatobacter stygius]|uniref:Uncharacterized protein n=1 Tax=Phreatobacter stygius TaxID=1940610 RepID=A0A4D7BC05_9HYPH|nr:hypothetical protein [Phreatobacter stygius]QCI65537.1 hypothetical protein E8M01_15775 [Phreatobacter stygius]